MSTLWRETMNNQIKKLAEQAGIPSLWTVGTDKQGNPILEKFAELIVRECMRMCDCADSSYLEHGCDKEASGAAGAKEIIKEWFEVEE